MSGAKTETSLQKQFSNSEPHQANPTSSPQTQDQWTATAYSASASFVPVLTHEIIQWLDPQPHDTILDLGCGDGLLTSQIHARGSRVHGLDASPNLLKAAQTTYGDIDGLTWNLLDCRYLEHSDLVREEGYTKVFSNAALHWILRDPKTRLSTLRGVYRALEPGGLFVAEMGGKGNCADVHAALLAALVRRGVGIERAREACPWFFPSEKLLKSLLEETGFRVERIKAVYRPTMLTREEGGGLEGWVRLMGSGFLDVVEEEEREMVVREVCEVLKTVVGREEDGSEWLGYVRLRVVARKV